MQFIIIIIIIIKLNVTNVLGHAKYKNSIIVIIIKCIDTTWMIKTVCVQL